MNSSYAGSFSPKSSPVLIGFAVFFVGIILIFRILVLISNWKIFKKAGQAGWKCLIPVYGNYILYKIAWKARWFFITLGVFFVLQLIEKLLLGIAVQTSEIIPIALTIIFGTFAVVIEIMKHAKLAKAFGKGGGFAVGLIFLPIIFLPILAFGSAEYFGSR